jgi:hypothetical protein
MSQAVAAEDGPASVERRWRLSEHQASLMSEVLQVGAQVASSAVSSRLDATGSVAAVQIIDPTACCCAKVWRAAEHVAADLARCTPQAGRDQSQRQFRDRSREIASRLANDNRSSRDQPNHVVAAAILPRRLGAGLIPLVPCSRSRTVDGFIRIRW